MLFAALFKPRPGVSVRDYGFPEKYKYPEGIKHVADYWLLTDDPAAILILKADDIGSIRDFWGKWNDRFDITVVPAFSGEEMRESQRRTVGFLDLERARPQE